jgi:hypothetical protein
MMGALPDTLVQVGGILLLIAEVGRVGHLLHAFVLSAAARAGVLAVISTRNSATRDRPAAAANIILGP